VPPKFVCNGSAILDPGNHGAFPGSGLKNDGGTGELWLVRIDRGTANLAAPIARLILDTSAALTAAKLGVRGIAILSLYTGDLIWVGTGPLPTDSSTIFNSMVTVLQSWASLDLPAPSTCATAALLTAGGNLSAINARGVAPFGSIPGALMVAIVDHGARPVAISNCGDPASSLDGDPACWARFGNMVLPRVQTRFAFFATPETGSTADMRASCLSVPGIPTQIIDALEASTFPYFDPLSTEVNAAQPGIAMRADLCQALGSGGYAQLTSFASSWAQLLIAQP
jgi:hypothetical protein